MKERKKKERNTYIKKLKKRMDGVNWKIMLKSADYTIGKLEK